MLDSLVRLRIELGEPSASTRVGLFPPRSTLERRDVTGLTGAELNQQRSELAAAPFAVVDGPHRRGSATMVDGGPLGRSIRSSMGGVGRTSRIHRRDDRTEPTGPRTSRSDRRHACATERGTRRVLRDDRVGSEPGGCRGRRLDRTTPAVAVVGFPAPLPTRGSKGSTNQPTSSRRSAASSTPTSTTSIRRNSTLPARPTPPTPHTTCAPRSVSVLRSVPRSARRASPVDSDRSTWSCHRSRRHVTSSDRGRSSDSPACRTRPSPRPSGRSSGSLPGCSRAAADRPLIADRRIGQSSKIDGRWPNTATA